MKIYPDYLISIFIGNKNKKLIYTIFGEVKGEAFFDKDKYGTDILLVFT